MKLITKAVLIFAMVGQASTGLAAANLPKSLKWLTNETPPLIGDPTAKKGGTVNLYMSSFPLSFRFVGPDSNGSFRGFVNSNRMSLVGVHPNTEEIIPELATHWAYGDDNKTMYYKINPKAKWSDGKPVLADDFVYALEFHKSKKIVAPWYNQYYEEQFESIIKYDDHTISITMREKKPELHLYASTSPIPKHFYAPLGDDFVKKYNWKIQPNTGAYQIADYKKGKSVSFERKKNWWAKDLPYYKNRFNVDKVNFKVIREQTVALQYLKKGKIDFMFIVWPDFWHEKTNDEPFKKGYINKLMFYTDGPESDYGLEFNTARPLLADRNVRLGVAHAVNVEKVIQKVLRGDYMRLQGISQGYGKYTNTKVSARLYDLKLANKYFDDAGFKEWGGDGIRKKGDTRLAATVTYSQPNMEPRLVVMREELKKAGFDLKLQRMDGATAFKSFLEKKHEIAYMAWGSGLRPQYYGRFHSSNANKPQTNNLTATADKEIDGWIEKYRLSTSVSERISLAHSIQAKVHESAVITPLFRVPYFRVAHWRWIKLPKVPGTKISSGIDLFDTGAGGIFWLDQDLKAETLKAKNANKAFKQVIMVDETFKPKG